MKCAECGADGSPVGTPDATADVTLTGQGDTQLRIAWYGIAYRQGPWSEGSARHWILIDRDRVRWLRDGPRTSRRSKWTLEIVLTDGTVIAAAAVQSEGHSADPEVLETVKRAARDHGYLAALTGKPTARMPDGPFTSRVFAVLGTAGFVTACAFTAALVKSLHPSVGALTGLYVAGAVLACCVAGCAVGARRGRRSVERHGRIAAAAQVAALRAAGHDVASAPERTWVLPRGRRKELRLDDHEITVREGGHSRFIAWDSVQWFRDSISDSGWALAIVLKDGQIVTPAATTVPRSRSVDLAAKVSQAARQHAIPAVLTGTPARPWIRPRPSDFARWMDKPGRYVDPGGELGLREWTRTGWLPDLHVDPATSGAAGQEGPPVIVSPLPGEVQRRLWEEAVSAVPRRREVVGSAVAIGGMFAVTAGWLYWPFVLAIVNAHGPGLVVLGSVGITLLTGAWAWFVDLPRRNARAAARLARAAGAALTASQASTEV